MDRGQTPENPYMSHRLIIVESPSKARTLAKFLGSAYTIKASMGHVRDLPKSKMGVDVDAGFTPQYEIIKGKEKQIKELIAAAKQADSVLLAADPDREGEAIAWHLMEALKLKDPDRVVFHEITKTAVEAALNNPRKIDRDLVAAQEARRVIDRLVGYRLSPLLWKKVRTVQSVAVRLVVDRETEIDAFQTKESWTIDALLAKGGSAFKARLWGRIADLAAVKPSKATTNEADAKDADEKSDKFELPDQAASIAVAKELGFDADGKPTAATPPFVVDSVDKRDTQRSAPLPYTTSTMQQDASTRLRFSPKRTMSIAQQLYEGADLGSSGPVGLITYMRTDSTRISDQAQADTATYVSSAFGEDFVRSGAARKVKANANANVQDAHEAVRPTDVTRTPDSVKEHLDVQQHKLYDLIWRRFVASQMSNAKFENTRVTVHAGDYAFRVSGSVLKFEGFTKVWRKDDDKDDARLPALVAKDVLDVDELVQDQHFTQPPPRYTEASLIKELEERGIGRPSTYAPTIETVQERNYVKQEDRRLYPTELGKTVDGVLREHFPDIVDVDFTAALERRLDGVEAGTRKYEPTVREWYDPFAATVTKAETNMERVKIPAKETGEDCPECKEGKLVVREGKFGEFVGCGRYPECKFIQGKDRTPPEPTGEECPQCTKPLVIRQGRRGAFVGCSAYPTCKYIKGDVPAVGEDGKPLPTEDFGKCPECEKPLARRSSKRGPFIGCTGYPTCRYIQPRGAAAPAGADGAVAARTAGPAPEPTGEECPDCGQQLVKRQGRFGPFVSCAGYPKCKYRPPKVSATAAAAGSR